MKNKTMTSNRNNNNNKDNKNTMNKKITKNKNNNIMKNKEIDINKTLITTIDIINNKINKMMKAITMKVIDFNEPNNFIILL